MLPDILRHLQDTRTLTPEQTVALTLDQELRCAVAGYFVQHKNRPLALLLLDACVHAAHQAADWGSTFEGDMDSATLMLAAWVVGLHGDVQDCLRVWEAKRVSFDCFCGVDVQLMAFCGLEATLAFLKTQSSPEATSALEYVVECAEAGDFDELEEWFPKQSLPAFV